MKTIFILTLIFVSNWISILSINAENKSDNPANEKKINSFHSKIFNKLTDNEKSKLKELKTSDPKAYKTEIKRLAKKYRSKNSKKRVEINAILEQLDKIEDQEQKDKLIKKLTDIVRKEFEERMEANKKNYEKASQRLKELKKKIDGLELNSEELISKKVKNLIKSCSTKKEKTSEKTAN